LREGREPGREHQEQLPHFLIRRHPNALLKQNSQLSVHRAVLILQGKHRVPHSALHKVHRKEQTADQLGQVPPHSHGFQPNRKRVRGQCFSGQRHQLGVAVQCSQKRDFSPADQLAENKGEQTHKLSELPLQEERADRTLLGKAEPSEVDSLRFLLQTVPDCPQKREIPECAQLHQEEGAVKKEYH